MLHMICEPVMSVKKFLWTGMSGRNRTLDTRDWKPLFYH